MELNAVADQCRTEGGLGVVLARLALSQTSNRANDCAGSGARMSRRNSDSANLIKVSIAPNPATSAFTIQFEKPVTDAIVKMYDVNGQLKGIWQAAGNQYTCQLTANLSGLYFLEVSEQGKVVSRNKILISH
ncbi:MAG: T9SS type A sorting domain-containing protein [Saprospiraceae bacterium]|nr:T9SS type A sorting domain-containing protein [Saprospiraceae bacterium]